MSAALGRLIRSAADRGRAAGKWLYRRPAIELARVLAPRYAACTRIGVTGTAGKTTTKDLLCSLLATAGSTVGNDDSNNQLYTVARTLLRARGSTRFVVQEVGAAEPGGLPAMVRLLAPQVAVVTNVANDHVSAFGSVGAIAAEKARLVELLPAGGLAVLNADDPRVAAMRPQAAARIVRHSLQGAAGADVQGEVLAAAWPEPLRLRVRAGDESVELVTGLYGRHQAGCVLAAVTCAWALGVPLATMPPVLAACVNLRGRMSVQRAPGGITFIRDDWKAPVWALPAAFQFMAEARASRRLIVLGTLSDYRSNSRSIYRQAVEAALQAADLVLVVGERGPSSAARASQPGRVHGFADVAACARWLREHCREGDLVMLKGSNRADHLGRVAMTFTDADVRCWRRRCGKLRFCERCQLVSLPSAEGA